MSDVGEVSAYKLNHLRSLIRDVQMLLDIVNDFERSYEIILLQMEVANSL